ncbi:hypothetical protein D3C76_1728060 [compost metagenome]
MDVAINDPFCFLINHRPDVGLKMLRRANPVLPHRALKHFDEPISRVLLYAKHAQC